jgi:hypothetical protein
MKHNALPNIQHSGNRLAYNLNGRMPSGGDMARDNAEQDKFRAYSNTSLNHLYRE